MMIPRKTDLSNFSPPKLLIILTDTPGNNLKIRFIPLYCCLIYLSFICQHLQKVKLSELNSHMVTLQAEIGSFKNQVNTRTNKTTRKLMA
jgi:hypothetical protein